MFGDFQLLHTPVIFSLLLDYYKPNGFEVTPHCGFDLHFTKNNDIEHIFMFSWPYAYHFERSVCSSSLPIY